MRKLQWNEEYIVSAEKLTEYGNKKIRTPKAHGFVSRYEAEKESEKLRSYGYKNIVIRISNWTE